MSLPIRVARFTGEWVEAVRAFNRRVAASGQQLPETPDPDWMPGMEVYLAIEGDTVRGGYILRRQCFWVKGRAIPVAHYRLPLSEGVIDRQYATLGLRLVRDALAREPRLYAMGMGGWDKPLPQMLKRLGWRVSEVPFRFKVLRASRFLRNIRPLRTSALRRLALDVAAFSGAGAIGMQIIGHGSRVLPAKFELAPSFDGWADAIWESARDSFPMIAVRDAATLDALYPSSDARFLRVRAGGGWAVALDTQMHDHKQFGDMRVGSIVDCLAAPRDAEDVIRAATGMLENRGVDLIISNQSHDDWLLALHAAGFRGGPSNYLVALSPALAALAGEGPEYTLHFNRGDGDGPIHL